MTRRMTRWCAALATVVAALVGVTGCGFNAQTLQPYTQADGINFQVGNQTKTPNQQVLKVRNLMILADSSGKGFLSGSMIIDPAMGQSSGSDHLQSVTGQELKPNGTPGGALTFGSFTPVEIGSAQLTILTDGDPITVSGTDLKPGTVAQLTLTFGTAGEYQASVPVVDRNAAEYQTVSPSPSASQQTS